MQVEICYHTDHPITMGKNNEFNDLCSSSSLSMAHNRFHAALPLMTSPLLYYIKNTFDNYEIDDLFISYNTKRSIQN